MTAFHNVAGFTLYYCVQHRAQPRYPYGLCGPFASKAEASNALGRLATVFPAAALCIEAAGFADDAGPMLAQDNGRARQQMECHA